MSTVCGGTVGTDLEVGMTPSVESGVARGGGFVSFTNTDVREFVCFQEAR